MLICPHILPMLLLYYCQWKIRGFKNALAEEQRKTEPVNLTRSFLDMDTERTEIFCWSAPIMRMCGSFLWSCLTFVSCVTGNSLRVLVQADRSCCIALWIQLRVGGAQMAVFMCFLCWLACCWVWCGLQRGEVKRTNTFLLEIPL